MRTKPSPFNAALEPIDSPLPATLASGIGRVIARHSYLEWVLGQVLYSLLEISIKQGRAVVRRPGPAPYVAAVQGLFAFHRLEPRFDFAALARSLEEADAARDALAHSVPMRDMNARGEKLYLVRGSWALDRDAPLVSRGAWPDTPPLDRATLTRYREQVEKAVKRAQKLQQLTDRLLRELHAARRTNPRLNRRRGDR